MFGKRKDIILSESTLVILESANKLLEYVTCGSAKKFDHLCIKFCDYSYDHRYCETQSVVVHGLATTSVSTHLFEAIINLFIKKSLNGDWMLDPNNVVKVVHNDLQISLVVSNTGGFSYDSPVQIEFHEELKRRWQFVV